MNPTVTLVCEVQYWLSDASISVEVMWFRSKNEQNAGIEGERLVSYYTSTSPSMNNDNTTNLQSFLLIMDFGMSDRGYYWCQMVVNNETLPPSPYGHIYSNQCSLFERTCYLTDHLICAHTSTSQQMAYKLANGINCTLEDYYEFTLSNISIATTSTSFTLPVINQTEIYDLINTNKTLQGVRCYFTKDGYPCAVGATIAAIVAAVSLLLLILSLLFCLKSGKKKGRLK